MTAQAKKKNWVFIIGILLLSVGMQFANYGSAICMSGDATKLNAMQYYVLISAFGTLGMMLILPIIGKLTAIMGMRKLIIVGIIIQTGGRFIMMFATNWVIYAIGVLVQAIGGGFYISSAYVNMASAVDRSETAKFFGYIAVANSIGALMGPLAVSFLHEAGGILTKLALVAYLPFTLVGLLLMLKDCPNERTAQTGDKFDYLGLVLMVVGVGLIVIWMNLAGKMFAWLSVPSIILAVVSIGSIIWMLKRESSIQNPAVPVLMFKNARLTYAFIGALVLSAYATCSGSYCVMWIRMNYQSFPAAAFFNGTAAMAQNIAIFILGLFLGGYIGRKFAKRFRGFGIAAMAACMLATAILYCLKFTGTAAEGNILTLGSSFPLGMLLIYVATAIGGFASTISQSTFSAYWQSNTPSEDIPSGQALYNFGATGGSCIFSAVVGVVLGSSVDYSKAFATGFVFALVGLICAIIGFKFTKEEIQACE